MAQGLWVSCTLWRPGTTRDVPWKPSANCEWKWGRVRLFCRSPPPNSLKSLKLPPWRHADGHFCYCTVLGPDLCQRFPTWISPLLFLFILFLSFKYSYYFKLRMRQGQGKHCKYHGVSIFIQFPHSLLNALRRVWAVLIFRTGIPFFMTPQEVCFNSAILCVPRYMSDGSQGFVLTLSTIDKKLMLVVKLSTYKN